MPKSSRGKTLIYVRAASLDELCRFSCNFDFTADNLFLSRNGGKTTIIALAESIANATLAFYVEAEPKSNLIKYTMPMSEHQKEQSVFAQNAGEQPGHYINIIDVEMKKFKPAKGVKKNELNIVKMGDTSSIINAVIKRSVKNEFLMHLYSFNYKGNLVLCGFDLIDELIDETKTLYYSVSKIKEPTSFARYDYINNKVEFTNTIGEHSYMYTKIINLAEPFPFFKMPN